MGSKLILPTFVVPSNIGLVTQHSGIDSPEYCRDRDHFDAYPHEILYEYNSRGYRDQEWPDDLNNAVWCLGDSFTAGLGSPITHTWPFLLQQALAQPCVNVSMDGASNDWILRKANELLDSIQPRAIVLHLSYLHRGESPDSALSDTQRRQHVRPGKINTAQWLHQLQLSIQQLNQRRGSTKIVYSFIPGWALERTFAHEWDKMAGADWCAMPATQHDWLNVPSFVNDELIEFGVRDLFWNWCQLTDTCETFVPEFEVQDWARDRHHYGSITAQHFAGAVAQLLNQRLI